MRLTLIFTLLIATTLAAPAPIFLKNGPFAIEALSARTSASQILETLLALLSRAAGGRGVRGTHPTVPIPAVTTIKATTLGATTVAATTLPASTIPATTIGTLTTISATTVAATTLAATTVSATTIAATTITVSTIASTSISTSGNTVASSAKVLDCVVPTTTLPSGASSLPSPTGTYVGSFNGSGTQNYDCTDLASTAAPSSIGADANLTSTASCGTGIHSFDNPTSPRFDMSSLGNTLASKNTTVASPDGSSNIAWVYLTAVDSTGDIVQLYRVDTVGGVAPSVCGNETGVVRVEYQATYMFYQG
ncbi:putative malate dehydrogenase [Phaeomoniella chlamydospora]|uniref:Putative malate dehydrogenase n=1 Tax=Phaeomoniella chlamydospora TaxID=158046 RepID=A0A0G2FW21_PHACM|nr:putative malate dehydrogenase [Phaeomoniella chlamydospora]